MLSKLMFVVGLLLAFLCFYLIYQFLEYGFYFLGLALVCFLGGFILYGIVYGSADPKAKVTRKKVILRIPGYGDYDYSANKTASRLK
ncbi:MAG TPA: hypothetical protein VGN86_14190 [Pyrinomonadaceae bacterium]|nr:hypothetical protein [Pyrinomonadaceae bacterium]